MSMRQLRLLLRSVAFPVLVTASAAIFLVPKLQPRAVQILSYQELLDRSDLAVIAAAIGRTADTGEACALPNISLRCVGVGTAFRVSAVLKGDRHITSLTLHHCRVSRTPDEGGYANGPAFVYFDPADPSRSGSYLLFLVREIDGRYAPAGGQMDPGINAITKLKFAERSRP